MDQQNSALSEEQLQDEFNSRVTELLCGSPSGMDEESLLAGVRLLEEMERNQVLLKLLQSNTICAHIREDGVPVFYLPDNEVEKSGDGRRA